MVWDPAKNRRNRRKHQSSFEEEKELFESGVEYLEIYDEAHSDFEDRFIAIGPIRRGRVLIVWTEQVEDTIRLISARLAKKAEIALYAAHAKETSDE